MNKTVYLSIGAILILLIGYLITSYNSLVTQSQNVQTAWAQVQNVYQRRADLIPNLVATVKGYAAHERQTLDEVTRARAAAVAQTPVNVVPDQQTLAQVQQTQAALSSALSRLMVVVERYPDLKANQNFLALQVELAGTENRIAVERQRYNQAVQQYNVAISRFPTNLAAHLFGYAPKAYFQAEQNAQIAPVVNF